MFYRGYGDGPNGREMGPKRQRMIEQGPPGPFYGSNPGSAFMYNPYGFVATPPTFPVVRLRGLPFDCAELDVVEFFHGLDVVDVLFIHKNNKLTGDAFCVLGYPHQIDFALHKNRHNMGRRYVEVFRSTKQEYYKAIANEVAESRVHGTVTGGGGGDGGAGGGGDGGGRGGGGGGRGGYSPRRNVQRARSSDDGKETAEHTGILRLRGLPFSAGKEDILDFFKDFDLSEDSVHVTVNGEGRPTGEAFVEFGSAEESRAAMVNDRKTLGSRYIELFPSSIEELEDALSRGR